MLLYLVNLYILKFHVSVYFPNNGNINFVTLITASVNLQCSDGISKNDDGHLALARSLFLISFLPLG